MILTDLEWKSLKMNDIFGNEKSSDIWRIERNRQTDRQRQWHWHCSIREFRDRQKGRDRDSWWMRVAVLGAWGNEWHNRQSRQGWRGRKDRQRTVQSACNGDQTKQRGDGEQIANDSTNAEGQLYEMGEIYIKKAKKLFVFREKSALPMKSTIGQLQN